MKPNFIGSLILVFLLIYSATLYTYPFSDPRIFHRIFAYVTIFFSILLTYLIYTKKIVFPQKLFFNNIPFFFDKSIGINTSNKFQNIALFAISFLLIAIFIFHFVAVTYGLQSAFFLGELDFVSMGEIINRVAKEGNFTSRFHGDFQSSYLSHHFAPGLVFFVPFYWITDDRLILAWSQCFFTIVIFIFIYLHINNFKWRRFEKYFWIIIFLTNIYLYRLSLSYHFEILYVVFFLGIYFFQKKSNIWGELICLFAALSIKEDIAIYLTIFYLIESIAYLITSGLHHSWQKTKNDLILSIFCFIVFFYFTPFLRNYLDVSSQENWINIWSSWGSSPLEILQNCFLHPVNLISAVLSKKNIFFEISMGFAFLFFLSPKHFVFIMIISSLHFISDRIWHNEMYNYYIYPILPALILGTIEGWNKIREASGKYLILILMLGFALILYRNSWDKNFPLAKTNQYTNISDYSNRLSNVKEIVQAIPKDSLVATQFDLGSFVSLNNPIMPIRADFPINESIAPDYILIDTDQGFSPYLPLDTIKSWEKDWINRQYYYILAEKNSLKLLKRK